jgi:hypothetical protein
MTSSFEGSNLDSLIENEFIWEYQTNVDPTRRLEWTPFSNAKSSVIEEAYKSQLEEIFIDENCRINLRCYIQKHINEPYREEAIRRQRQGYLPSIISIDEQKKDESSFCGRLCSPLGEVLNCSTTKDTTYYGSSFINTWLLMFTKGKMKVTFDTIFPALVKGLIKEGEIDTKDNVSEVETMLNMVERETHGKSSKEKMEQLQDCCAKLYTKDCYIYRVVNAALRGNDQTKVYTLGPYSYLLFNYIGRRFKGHFSIADRLRGVFKSNKIHSMILYRGDRDSASTVEEYRRAAGDNSKYFKWLPFVSTSRDRAQAEKFLRGGVLYIIEMRYYSFNEDQFTDISICSDFPTEEEILLLPGVIFQVNKLEFDHEKGIQLIYIKIKSSYISKLK